MTVETGEMETKDPKMIELRYAQAKHDIITSNYVTDAKTAVKLAALIVQNVFGKHNPSSHKPGFLTERLMEFIPISLFMAKKNYKWENEK